MTHLLRLLIVEDSENDSLLLLRELQRGGYKVDSLRVETAGEMKDALESREWDIIICDYSLPQFSAQSALQILRETGLDIPFIIVSGTIGEQRAVATLKEGAHDFLIKNNLARLIPAIERELGDANVRRERRQAEAGLRQRDQELRQRNIELTRLYRASEALLIGSLSSDLPSLAKTIVETVLQEFEQANCTLFLVNNETNTLERLDAEGQYVDELVNSSKLKLDEPGLITKAVRTGEVLNIPDLTIEKDHAPIWKQARSALIIPLRVGNEIIGALDVQSAQLDAFHADDERLMTIFAERAALMIERTRLHDQTTKQLQRLEALRTIDLAITSSFDMRVSLDIVLGQILFQLNVDAAAVLLLRSGTTSLEFVAGRGFRTRHIEATKAPLGRGLAGVAALEKRLIVVEDLMAESETFTRYELLSEEEFVSYFAVPLVAKGEVRGVLEIFSRKPLSPDLDWYSILDSLRWQTAIAVDNALLFEGIQASNFELAKAYDETIEGWSNALDLRDKETEGHTLRVTEMTLRLARSMGFSDEDLVQIRRGALLHDIGKMGVPDHILLKPDKLEAEEWEIMKQHPQLAYNLLQPIAYLRGALDIPYSHHEKWDGTGYPRGLSGEQIPLQARLFAVVDVWDAITSDRPYREKWSKEKALDYIREQSGKQFDPKVVEVFLREIKEGIN